MNVGVFSCACEHVCECRDPSNQTAFSPVMTITTIIININHQHLCPFQITFSCFSSKLKLNCCMFFLLLLLLIKTVSNVLMVLPVMAEGATGDWGDFRSRGRIPQLKMFGVG